MVRFLFRNLKGYRFLVFLALTMAFAQVIAALFTAFPLKIILDKVVNHQNPNPALNPLISFVDNLVGANPNSATGIIIFSATAIVVLGVLTGILQYTELFLASYIAQNLTARLRKQLFGHLERLSLDWHGKQKKGDLVNRITSNISDIEKLVTDGLVDLLAGSLTLVGVISVMLIFSKPYTLIALSLAPALFLTTLLYTRNIRAAAKQASRATGQVSDVATEDINALTVIKVFTREQ